MLKLIVALLIVLLSLFRKRKIWNEWIACLVIKGPWLLVPGLPAASCLALVAHLSAPGLGRAGQYKVLRIVPGFPASWCSSPLNLKWTSRFTILAPPRSSNPAVPFLFWCASRNSYTASECTIPLVPEAAARDVRRHCRETKTWTGEAGTWNSGSRFPLRHVITFVFDWLFICCFKKDVVKIYIAIQPKFQSYLVPNL